MNLKKLQRKLKVIDTNIEASFKDSCLLLTGEVDNYTKVFKAGKLATKVKSLGVLNDIKVKGNTPKIRLPEIQDEALEGKEVDVLVIGGGISGTSILRELSKYNLKALLVEKDSDLASGQSSRNGGVVHTGLSYPKGSLRLKYCVEGNKMYKAMCEDLHVPFYNTGQVTFARRPLEMLALRIAAKGGKKKGIDKLKILNREELLKYEPSVPEWSIGGLYMGTGGITCPHTLTIALAENAVENGAEVSLDTAVIDMTVKDQNIVEVLTNRGRIYPKVVINAAGVYADKIAELAFDRTFTIHPRSGTYLVTDKKIGHIVNGSMGKTPFTLAPSTIAKLPKKHFAVLKATIKNLKSPSKGIGLIKTVDDNVLIGPNAKEVIDREDYATERLVADTIFEVQQEVQPSLKKSDIIAYFTGVRAATYEEEFVVRQGIKTKNIFEVAGIQSPGLTAAPAIAVDAAKWTVSFLEEQGFKVEENKTFNPKRKYQPILKHLSLEERDKLIKENKDYGEIVCRCEEISKGEIIASLNSPIPVYTVDAIKKRVRPGMGRCQGTFCLSHVMKIIANNSDNKISDAIHKTL
jgi:glycerol-3-phosphate dehydrogenase